jgi:hypothetical protein
MTDEADEARVRELLAELRAAQPDGSAVVPRVTRAVRWQRPLRHTLEGIGALGGGLASGLLALLRPTSSRGRRR